MGSGKTSKPNKSSKPPLSPPEPSGTPNTPPFPDLPNSSQASYGGGATPPRLASNAAETGSASVSVPALRMDLWNASPGSEGRKLQPTPQSSAAMNQQDERELKRQKRKQSNRESARRSRLRKQAECEELQHRVDALTNENHTLQEELRSLWNECEKLESDNTSLKEELTMFCSPKVASDLDNSRSPSQENGGNL